MKPKFADLHCHPHMRSFNWLHDPGRNESQSRYNPWWIILPNFKKTEEGGRAASYSQNDMAKIVNGNVRLSFASLYPLEKGWVKGKSRSIGEWLIDYQKYKWKALLAGLISNEKKEIFAIRDLFESIYMKLPIKKINFFQSDSYNYFSELTSEKDYLARRSNVFSETELYIPLQKRLFVNRDRVTHEHSDDLRASGTYVIARSGKDVERIIKEEKYAFVLTIEGTNVFNSDRDIETIKQNVMEMKSWGEPVFFVTFSHHFYNYLCGHAHSIPSEAGGIIDQVQGMNSGFTPNGKEIARLLLSVDENLEFAPSKFGRRILIDVKHMSAVARKEYYSEFIKPLMARGDVIPVIASHVAYSGRTTLDDQIRDMDNETDTFTFERFGNRFNAWNINLCDEDIMTVFKTGGLIGLNFDQRVLGIPFPDKDNNERHIHYFWQNYKAMMKVIIESSIIADEEKEKVIRIFSLGTDFDGYIDPMNKYSTDLDLEQFRSDLIQTIENDPEKEKFLFGKFTVEQLADRLCFENAYEFVVKNFREFDPNATIDSENLLASKEKILPQD